MMVCDYLQARIDRSAVEHNCRLLRACTRGCKLCVAVKADAYGHGVRVVLPVLNECGVDMVGVACLDEGVEVRELEWTRPVLVFGSEFSVYSSARQDPIADMIVHHELRITGTRLDDLAALSKAAQRRNRFARIHLALDTGMSRMGLAEEPLWDLLDGARRLPGIEIEGLYTHFASADCADKRFAREQLARFNAFLARVRTAGIKIPIVHAANSGATVDLPEAHFDMIRPGISVYGYQASGDMHHKADLRPCLRLMGFLTLVKTIPTGSFVGYGCTFQCRRETTVGIVPAGYADGYFRELSNRGQMIVKDRFVPVIGRVSMDQTIVDLTDLVRDGIDVRVGDEVVLYDHRPESVNSVEKTAALLDTIPYVITTSLGRRIKRIGV